MDDAGEIVDAIDQGGAHVQGAVDDHINGHAGRFGFGFGLALVGFVLAITACGRSESVARPPRPVIPVTARELVTAVVDDWNSTHATLRTYRRDGGAWHPVGNAWPGVIGRSGSGWGVGLHGVGAPTGRGGPIKREGDGKSPAGAFAVRGAYGYAAHAPVGTRISYTALDDAWRCVDDPASSHYNRILDARGITVDWKSAEMMRRPDALYTWVVDVAHNPSATPDSGSCVFLHVWGGADSTTSGCTAMADAKLTELIATLAPSAVFVLLPKSEYAAIAPMWGLP